MLSRLAPRRQRLRIILAGFLWAGHRFRVLKATAAFTTGVSLGAATAVWLAGALGRESAGVCQF